MRHSMIPDDVVALSQSRVHAFQTIYSKAMPASREAGQIWSTLSTIELVDGRSFRTEEPRLVVILDFAGEYLDPYERVTVAPISLRTEMACQWDLIISKDVSPVGFEFMVEVWNETQALVGQLNNYLGNLPMVAQDVLTRIYGALLEDENPRGVEEWVGFPLMGEQDPRVPFQSAELEAVAYLANAATAVLELNLAKHLAEELGENLAQSAGTVKPVKETHGISVFDLRPLFGRLSEYLPRRALMVAQAASAIREENTCIIHGRDPQGSLYFTFELLNSRRSPYSVYAKVHDLSQSLEGAICTLTVITKAAQLRSDPATLYLDASVLIGQDAHFRGEDVEAIKVEIG